MSLSKYSKLRTGPNVADGPAGVTWSQDCMTNFMVPKDKCLFLRKKILTYIFGEFWHLVARESSE